MQDTPIQKALSEILNKQSFDELNAYQDPELWTSFTADDRTLLAKLFMMRAENELKEPATEHPVDFAKKDFAIASQLVPDDPVIWNRRGLALSEQEDSALLAESAVCFEKAISLKEAYFDAWLGLGNVLVRKALITEDSSLLNSAEEKYRKAEQLLDEVPQSEQVEKQFFWQFGFVSFMIARHSEEAVDLHKAIQYYRKAQMLGLDDREFFNDFGNALVELSLKISQEEMMFEAIELYLRSLDEDDESASPAYMLASRNFNLGSCYHFLFEIHHDEVFFRQAEECFSKAVGYNSIFVPALRHWANLMLYAAKLWQDVLYLEAANGIYKKAHEIVADDPVILTHWSEVLCHLGSHEDDLSMLQKALQLAEHALEIDPDSIEALTVSGLAYHGLGRYFEDKEYYELAKQQLEKALVKDHGAGVVWHALANVRFTQAQMLSDLHLLEEAIVCFHWASRREPSRFGHFWNDWAVALLYIADFTQNPKLVEEAVEKFEQAILCQEEVHPQWLINFGASLDFLGDLTDDETCFEKAIQILTHSLQLDPESITARYHLGIALCHLGEVQADLELLQKAVSELEKVVESDPEDENAYNDLGLAFMHVADLSTGVDPAVRHSMYESAKANFMQAHSLGSLVVLYNLACVCALQQKSADALVYLRKAKQADVLPDVEDLLDDTWLEGLRGKPEFQEFLQECSKDGMCTEM